MSDYNNMTYIYDNFLYTHEYKESYRILIYEENPLRKCLHLCQMQF